MIVGCGKPPGASKGWAGLARLARQTGRPEALRAWCRALAERGQWADALRAYKEAVEVVGKSHSRGGFLDGAALAAQQLGRRDATKCLEAAWLGGAALRCIPPSCERSSRGAVWFDRVGYAVMINSDDAPSIMKIGKLVRNFQTRKLEPRETPEASEITAEHRTMEGFYYPINSRQQVVFFSSGSWVFRSSGSTGTGCSAARSSAGKQSAISLCPHPCMPEKRPA